MSLTTIVRANLGILKPATAARGILLFVMLAAIGCGGKEPEKKSSATSSETPTTKSVTTLPSSPAEPVASPALAFNSDLPSDATPDEVCRRFLECLKLSERTAAEKLLSKRALTNTKRENLNLESPGGPNSSFTVLPPRYATNKKELATVDCIVRDTLHGQATESKLSWMLRLEPAGWKISGMILDSDDGKSLDLLSFENPVDVARIKQTLQGDSETEVAERPDPDSNRK